MEKVPPQSVDKDKGLGHNDEVHKSLPNFSTKYISLGIKKAHKSLLGAFFSKL